MKKRLIPTLILCVLSIPGVIMTTKGTRATKPAPANPTTAKQTEVATQDTPANPPAPRKTRPGITELLPPGYELTENRNGRYFLTIPGNKGVYSTGAVSVADRGLVFKGPVAMALSKDGPWVAYAGENAAMHLAKDGTIKLSGQSALIREDDPAPADAKPEGKQD